MQPMDTITRKTLLYRSGLGFWCINHVQGCAHACRYPCYALMMARAHGRVPEPGAWFRPKLVVNALELLEREIPRKRDLDQVHLCLTTDPFMVGYPEVTQLSLAIIELLNRHGVACSILTKGELPVALADERRFRRDNTIGISLISIDEGFRRRWEPGAAAYATRIAALRTLHDAGCRTLVHMEPYPTPNIITQDVEALLAKVDFVDELFFGGWNYNRRLLDVPGRDAFYEAQAKLVERSCRAHDIVCQTCV